MAASQSVYQLCQPLLQPSEVIKVATQVPKEASSSHQTILAVIANVESGLEEAALVAISTKPSAASSVKVVVPIYADFKVTFEQVATDQVSPLESAGKPVQARFQASFTADGGRASTSVTTSELRDLEDLLTETRRLTDIAEQNAFSSSSPSHAWLAPYLVSLPNRPRTAPSSPSAVSTLFSYGNKAIEGLPGLASTFGSFGFFNGTANTAAKSRGIPSAMSIFGPGNGVSTNAGTAAVATPKKQSRPSLDKVTLQRLDERRGEFTKQRKINIHVCTYNTNGQFCDAKADLSAWIRPESEPDLLVVGLQEMDLRPEVLMVRHDPLVGEAWTKAILACLHKSEDEKDETAAMKYTILETKQLAGMWIAVFAQEQLVKDDAVAEVATTSVMTGWAGFAGNKGACCVRLRLYDTYLCFVCAHLAAFQDMAEKRNADYRDICNRAIFSSPAADSPSGFHYCTIFDSHVTVFFGDLNYRIDRPIEAIKAKVTSEKYEDLLAHDQMKRSQKDGLAFERFHEADIAFPPTYKYDKGTDDYDSSEKERKPAWTDRVLWKSNAFKFSEEGGEHVKVECKEYTAIKELRMSDHKPVLAKLELEIPLVDQAKRDKIIEEIQGQRKDG